MDIPQLATILSSTFDPNLREEAEKKLNEVSVRVTFVRLRAYSIISRDIIPDYSQAKSQNFTENFVLDFSSLTIWVQIDGFK